MGEASSKTVAVEATPGGAGFGTFKGVFTPSILTILGVIMYLRMGYILGNAGLGATLLIVTMSSLITLLTGLSISAIATNMKVGGGGAYYMISRSLGLEPGAAIGLPLFFSQALVVSFYIAGFSESIHALFPTLPTKAIGVATLVVLTALAYFSADLALKTQFLILAAIVFSLVSLFAGGMPEGGLKAVGEVPETVGFWVIFALFFPAVTGIEAGIAMSGDLKDPARSLPLGTIAAVVTGYAVYMAIPIFLSGFVPREVLLTDNLMMQKIAWIGEAILVGIWGATLSSALASLLGAPRTLQALARDGVVPRFLGRGHGDADEPRVATGAAFLIALAGVLLGDLDAIAPILSMFFLTSYGVLNFSAGFEGLISSPSWRPTFRTPWGLSLLGAFGCVATMFMINAGATFIAAFLCGTVFYLMERRQLRAHWGDMRHGLLMLLARYAVYRLDDSKPDERSWRPSIMVLSGSPASRWYLIELGDALTHGDGFLSVAAILTDPSGGPERVSKLRDTVKAYLQKRNVPALVQVAVADDVMKGAQSLVRHYGIGPLVPNTYLLGESEEEENLPEFIRLLFQIHESRRNVVLVREGQAGPYFGGSRRIDVWWGLGLRRNAGLMLALGYMLKTSSEWRRAELYVKTIVDSEEQRPGAEQRHREFLTKTRLQAQGEVIVRSSSEHTVFQTIREASQGAHLVFLGLRPPEEGQDAADYSAYYKKLLEETKGLPPTALVMGAENIAFSRIFD